eukprot:809369-Prorocentrum_minimum.AAC.2
MCARVCLSFGSGEPLVAPAVTLRRATTSGLPPYTLTRVYSACASPQHAPHCHRTPARAATLQSRETHTWRGEQSKLSTPFSIPCRRGTGSVEPRKGRRGCELNHDWTLSVDQSRGPGCVGLVRCFAAHTHTPVGLRLSAPALLLHCQRCPRAARLLPSAQSPAQLSQRCGATPQPRLRARENASPRTLVWGTSTCGGGSLCSSAAPARRHLASS